MAAKFAGDIIKFVSGDAPWAAFETASKEAMTYGPSHKSGSSIFSPLVSNEEQKSGRRSTIYQLGEVIPLDELLRAWGNFISGQ